MPRVTKLEPVGARGDRRRVHVDGEVRARLSADACDRLGLAEGRELTEEELRRVESEGRRQEAMDGALSYLSHRPRSRAEVRRHLRGKDFAEPAVEHALARCEELGYLDDREFAAGWARDRIRLKPRGRLRLVAELRQKGVSEGDAEAGVDRAFREAEVTERDLLERAARKRWESRRSDDPRTVRRRVSGYLKRRGFPFHEIREVVDRLLAELE